MKTARRIILSSLTILSITIGMPIWSAEVDLDQLGQEGVDRLQQYLRVDTINPPGNESRAVEFFARIFEAEGVAYETAESAPGRGNIWARLAGGSEPALVLLNHTDVVPADEEFWDSDPLSGEIKDGHIHGRGALDMIRHRDRPASGLSGVTPFGKAFEPGCDLDCRILPDQDPEAFLNELRFIIDDPHVTLETIMVFTPAVSSTDTPLYRAIENVVGKHFPGAPIVPNVGLGFTDSHFFRDLGISCYGFSPTLIPASDWGGVHGNNERISIENVHRGVRLTLEILEEVVY